MHRLIDDHSNRDGYDQPNDHPEKSRAIDKFTWKQIPA